MKTPQFRFRSRECRSFRENRVIQKCFERFEPSRALALDSADTLANTGLLVQ